MQNIKRIQTEKLYRTYVTDLIGTLIQYTARTKLDIPRYTDIIEPKKTVEKPKETAKQIISKISKKLDRLSK